MPRNAHSAPLLEELHLESLEKRRKDHVSDIVLRVLQGRCHPALRHLFVTDGTGRIVLQSRPVTASGRKRFSYVAAELYNAQVQL